MDAMTKSRIEVTPLSKHVAAEVRGVDLTRHLDKEEIALLNEAWLKHLVLIFRDQKISQEDLLRTTEYFGPLGKVGRPPKLFPPGFKSLLTGIIMVSNIRENGEPIGVLPDGEMMFHHDMIHHKVPHDGTLLYSIETPSEGGDTMFASGYAAYDTLDPSLKAKLEGRRAIHHYNYGSTQRGDGRGIQVHEHSEHPVFRTHEKTGRKAIYVNRLMTTGIVGMSDEEALPLLEALFDHMEKPEFVHAHKWRPHDLVLWDNRCSTHARTDFPSTQRRLLLRTTVAGNVIPV